MIRVAVKGKGIPYRPEDFHFVVWVCFCECDYNWVLIENPSNPNRIDLFFLFFFFLRESRMFVENATRQ